MHNMKNAAVGSGLGRFWIRNGARTFLGRGKDISGSARAQAELCSPKYPAGSSGTPERREDPGSDE